MNWGDRSLKDIFEEYSDTAKSIVCILGAVSAVGIAARTESEIVPYIAAGLALSSAWGCVAFGYSIGKKSHLVEMEGEKRIPPASDIASKRSGPR